MAYGAQGSRLGLRGGGAGAAAFLADLRERAVGQEGEVVLAMAPRAESEVRPGRYPTHGPYFSDYPLGAKRPFTQMLEPSFDSALNINERCTRAIKVKLRAVSSDSIL